MKNIIDLHCHTNESDGLLSPFQICERAQTLGIEVLSITDHDTIAAHQQLKQKNFSTDNLTLITGVELSTSWLGHNIHVLALNFDLNNPNLISLMNLQSQARKKRTQYIASALAAMLKPAYPKLHSEQIIQEITTQETAKSLPINDPYQSDHSSHLGRPHFARWLERKKIVRNTKDAFKNYLNEKKLSKLSSFWITMQEGISQLKNLQCSIILAHPGRYHISYKQLNQLIQEFRDAGGTALEVISGNQTTKQTEVIAKLCRKFELQASQGSDLHYPTPYRDLGLFPELPPDLTPVWKQWESTKKNLANTIHE